EGIEVVIASSDKDFLQLINDRVKMLNPADKSSEPMDAASVVAKTGVRPEQIVDWLSLVGDAADNIPGVPGVGVKTAAALLNEFGSVDGIYERLGKVKRDKLRDSLAAAELEVRRNQSLVKLKLDLSGEPELADLRCGFQDSAKLEELYEAWGFKALLNNLREARQGALFA
ncbi:MAG: 5'-3' exonuclease H3TH domain-containing protein, partial [Verrucomicrobiota bacterium]|nr:5'-3' exonuclease H3TH domain-containing protein [Verrucomicrobiota bacterium]